MRKIASARRRDRRCISGGWAPFFFSGDPERDNADRVVRLRATAVDERTIELFAQSRSSIGASSRFNALAQRIHGLLHLLP
jgi:hypothetical protein